MNKIATLLFAVLFCLHGTANALGVSIAQTYGTNPSCANATIGFTATPIGSPTSPTYKWFVNGVQVSVTNPFYTNTIATGSVVFARMYFANGTGTDSATSNTITVTRQATVTPSVTIAITSGSNPGCAGSSITFTATPVNGGTTPVYQWRINGVLQAGATGNTFTTTALVNGSYVIASLTSSATCPSSTTVTSNFITFTALPTTASAIISIQSGTNPSCDGKPITFKVTPTNGGTAPAYQWLVNNAAVPGATATTFTTSTLNNLDSVQVRMITNAPCVTNTTIYSNVLHITVLPVDTIKVSAALTQGANPGCKDSLLRFTATGVNAGATPAYAWFVNGSQVATGAVYSSTTLNNNDVIRVRLVVTGAGCRFSDTAYAAPILLNLYTTPTPAIISFLGTMLVSDSVHVQWYGPSGLIPGATLQTYHPTAPGPYYATVLNGSVCASPKSNILTLSLLNVSQYNLSNVRIFPNPTTGQLLIDWGTAATTARITIYTPSGQAVLQDVAENATRKSLDLSGLANGVYFVVLQDESGRAGMVRILLAK